MLRLSKSTRYKDGVAIPWKQEGNKNKTYVQLKIGVRILIQREPTKLKIQGIILIYRVFKKITNIKHFAQSSEINAKN